MTTQIPSPHRLIARLIWTDGTQTSRHLDTPFDVEQWAETAAGDPENIEVERYPVVLVICDRIAHSPAEVFLWDDALGAFVPAVGSPVAGS